MNVTFLIGNGFDLACGLQTRYDQFTTKYCKLPSRSDAISSFKEEILKNADTWADAELAFGKYTQNFSLNKFADFQECLDDFINEMGKYLLEQETSLEDLIVEKKGIDRFRKGLVQFNEYLPESSRSIISDVLEAANGKRREINVIVFNYTNIFENLVTKLHDSDSQYIGSSKVKIGAEAVSYLGNVVYAHGKLNRSSLIFGLDNETQILNKQLLDTGELAYALIKPEANSYLFNESQRTCFELIAESSIICIFGMSIGLTDETWWKKIAEWLKNDPSHQLIQHAWISTCIRSSSGSYKRALVEYREYLHDRLLLSEDEKRLLQYQIHIECNIDLFGVSESVKPSTEYITVSTLQSNK